MESFKHVRLGITFVYIGLVLTVLAILMVPISIVTRFLPLLLAAIPLSFASSLVSMVGRILCLTAPRQMKPYSSIVTSVVFDLLALISSLGVAENIPGVPELSNFSQLLSMAAVVFFLIFLKRLAVYIKDDKSAVRASNLLNLAIGIVVVMVAMIFVPPIAILALIFVIVGFFIYNRLLWGLRKNLRPIASLTPNIAVASQPNDIQ